MKDMSGLNRRSFIKKSAGLAATVVSFPYIIRPSALGLNGSVAPSNRITVGCVGMNWMGMGNLGNFLNRNEAQVLAVCDVDKNHLQRARETTNSKYGNSDCAAYVDFRELILRSDIDAVCLSLPDHWHAIPAIMAAKSGKDIYGEKPFSHTLREGRAMCEAVKENGVIWQTGSWQRSVANFRQACEIVRNGLIGTVKTVHVGLPSGHYGPKDETMKAPPAELDYDRWLGPAPYEPYCEARVHVNWRWHYDYGGGQLMDWIGHHGDIAHWGLDLDHTGPVEFEGTAEFPKTGLWNSALKYRIKARYANGLQMIIAGGHSDIKGGTTWFGDKGWVHVDRGSIDADPKELLDVTFGPGDVRLYHSNDHVGNFLECIKTRRQTITPAETAHRSASIGHLALIAIKLGRKIRFNPETEEILGDEAATRMLGKTMRSPWTI